MTLRRATILTASCDRRQRHFLEHAVDARADAEELFVRLEMDVRGALLDGVEQDFIDEAHDRRVLDIVPGQRVGVRVLIAGGDFEVLEIEIIFGQARHGRVGLIDGLVDRHLQLVVLDHDELDAHRGLEADLIERMQIGRVRDGQEQPLAALHQGQYPVLLHELVAHRPHRVQVGRHGVQIEEGHPEFVRCGDGDIARARQVRSHEVGHQALAPFLRLGNGVLHGGLIQQAVLDQPLGETAESQAIGAAGCRYCVVIHGLKSNPGTLLSTIDHYYR